MTNLEHQITRIMTEVSEGKEPSQSAKQHIFGRLHKRQGAFFMGIATKPKQIAAMCVCCIALIATVLVVSNSHTQALITSTKVEKLASLFQINVKDLKEVERKTINDNEVTVYQSNGLIFEVNSNGLLVRYFNKEADLKPSKQVTIKEALDQALKFLDKVYPQENISTFKLASSQYFNHGDAGEEYSFGWSLDNSTGTPIRYIGISTTLSGEVFSYLNSENKMSEGIVEKVSKDDAIKIVTDTYKLQSDPSFKEIKRAEKWVYKGRVYWYVQVLREYKDKTNPNVVLPSLIGYPVDTETGEIADIKM
jgi:hypothetical protein